MTVPAGLSRLCTSICATALSCLSFRQAVVLPRPPRLSTTPSPSFPPDLGTEQIAIGNVPFVSRIVETAGVGPAYARPELHTIRDTKQWGRRSGAGHGVTPRLFRPRSRRESLRKRPTFLASRAAGDDPTSPTSQKKRANGRLSEAAANARAKGDRRSMAQAAGDPEM